jgi:HK97 family phage prohead protease
MTDSRSELLKGAPERRGISEFEVREAKNGLLHFSGHAAVFDQPYEVTDRYGVFTEIIERNALARTLSRNPDVVLNINHDGLPLARTTSGTLRIGADARGLYVEADLEPKDPDVDRIRHKLERGDMSDMSWAFRVTVDEWSEDETQRNVQEVNIDGGDVSIVTTGANRNTTAHLRSIIDSLPRFEDALVECRSADAGISADDLRAASKLLGELATELTPRKTMSIKAAERAALLD